MLGRVLVSVEEKRKREKNKEASNTVPRDKFSGMHACDCFVLGVAIMQDYTEEFRDITKGSKSKEALPAGSITLINQRPVGEDLHVKFLFCLQTNISDESPV